MTDLSGPPRLSGSTVDLGALDGLARDLLVASNALFDAGRSVQRHSPDAGDPPAGRRVSDLQRAALAALRSLAGGLDAASADAIGARAGRFRSDGGEGIPTLGRPGRVDG